MNCPLLEDYDYMNDAASKIPIWLAQGYKDLSDDHVTWELNQLLFKSLWKGEDKTTRLSVIHEYEKGSLKMIDLETMITSLKSSMVKKNNYLA